MGITPLQSCFTFSFSVTSGNANGQANAIRIISSSSIYFSFLFIGVRIYTLQSAIMFLVKAISRMWLYPFNHPTGSVGCPFNNLFTTIATNYFFQPKL